MVNTAPSATLGPMFATVAMTMALVPAAAVGVLDMASATSATACTAVAVVSATPVGSSSLVAVAVFDRSPLALLATYPLMATYTLSPGNSVPTLQVTTPAATVHAPRLDAAIAFSTLAGSGSLAMTFVAALGPVLLTTIWYAIAWFGAIVAGPNLAMLRPSSTVTLVDALA